MLAEDCRIYEIVGPEVISKDFGDEVVVANLNTGLFYSLNNSGRLVWLHLQSGGVVLDFIQTSTAEELSVLRSFIQSLVQERLLSLTETERRLARSPQDSIRLQPHFERFDDLQGLLLIDPIHEVSDEGWPLRP